MGKKSKVKKEKKIDILLSKEEREERVEKLRDLFREKNAWDPETYEALKKFDDVCKEFVEKGETVEGKIPFPEIKKKIHYMINSKKRHEPILHLLHVG